MIYLKSTNWGCPRETPTGDRRLNLLLDCLRTEWYHMMSFDRWPGPCTMDLIPSRRRPILTLANSIIALAESKKKTGATVSITTCRLKFPSSFEGLPPPYFLFTCILVRWWHGSTRVLARLTKLSTTSLVAGSNFCACPAYLPCCFSVKRALICNH